MKVTTQIWGDRRPISELISKYLLEFFLLSSLEIIYSFATAFKLLAHVYINCLYMTICQPQRICYNESLWEITVEV